MSYIQQKFALYTIPREAFVHIICIALIICILINVLEIAGLLTDENCNYIYVAKMILTCIITFIGLYAVFYILSGNRKEIIEAFRESMILPYMGIANMISWLVAKRR